MRLNLNLRRLKRSERGFSLLTDKAIEALTQTLCESCGRRVDCSVRRQVERYDSQNIKVLECQDFQAPLKFQDKLGTQATDWNTIRIGGSWADRLKPGDVVALVDKFNVKYGAAEVLRVYKGDRDAMIRFHARHNHMLAHTSLGHVEALTKILIQAYGPAIYTTCKEVSVIYLRTL